MNDQFIRTKPDYDSPQSGLISPDVDIGELSSRLNRLLTFRREGRLVHYTDFSPSMNGWRTDYAFTVTPNTTFPFSGSGSLSMEAGIGFTCNAYLTLPVIGDLKVGMSFMTSYLFYPYPSIQWEMTYFDGVNSHVGAMKYDYRDSKLYFWNFGGGWSLLTTLSPIIGSANWANFKLVIDFTKNVYAYVMYNAQRIDMGYAMQSNVSSGTQKLFLKFTSQGDTVVPNSVQNFVDNVLVTSDESVVG